MPPQRLSKNITNSNKHEILQFDKSELKYKIHFLEPFDSFRNLKWTYDI